jgi:hypothetical protein
MRPAGSMKSVEEPQETIPAIRVAGYCLAIMIFAAAVIHFAIAARYVEQYWLFGASTLVIAWVQALWAIGVAVRPARSVLRSGAVLNTAVLLLYLVTLATGFGIGAAPRGAGLSGFGDGLCVMLEAAGIAGCAWLLRAGAGNRMRRERLVFAPPVVGGATAVLVGVALAVAGPASVASTGGATASGSGTGMHMPGLPASATAIKLATTSPAGDITMPNPDMQMADGMKMASSTACTATPTAAQQQAAVTMVNTSWQDSRKYQSLAAAKAAGYRAITPAGARVVHYLSPAAYRATVLGGPVLDYADPQSLVYANTPKGAVLVAAMYITTPHGPTPQPGGCLTQWHVHTNLCLTKGLGVVGAVGRDGSACPAGSRNRVTPPMIHVWFVPVPGGPTAIDAPDAQVVHAAEQVSAPANGTA